MEREIFDEAYNVRIVRSTIGELDQLTIVELKMEEFSRLLDRLGATLLSQGLRRLWLEDYGDNLSVQFNRRQELLEVNEDSVPTRVVESYNDTSFRDPRRLCRILDKFDLGVREEELKSIFLSTTTARFPDRSHRSRVNHFSINCSLTR